MGWMVDTSRLKTGGQATCKGGGGGGGWQINLLSARNLFLSCNHISLIHLSKGLDFNCKFLEFFADVRHRACARVF